MSKKKYHVTVIVPHFGSPDSSIDEAIKKTIQFIKGDEEVLMSPMIEKVYELEGNTEIECKTIYEKKAKKPKEFILDSECPHCGAQLKFLLTVRKKRFHEPDENLSG